MISTFNMLITTKLGWINLKKVWRKVSSRGCKQSIMVVRKAPFNGCWPVALLLKYPKNIRHTTVMIAEINKPECGVSVKKYADKGTIRQRYKLNRYFLHFVSHDGYPVFQTEFKFHHELYPFIRIFFHFIHDCLLRFRRQSVIGKNFFHLSSFRFVMCFISLYSLASSES